MVAGKISTFNLKDEDFHYSLNAYVTYESRGACPTVMVGKDTLIIHSGEKRTVYL